MATSSERKKGIAGRRGATRRRVNLTRRHTRGKPLARAPRPERRIAGLTVSEIKRLHETDYRGFYAFFVLLTNAESMEVMELIISD